MCGIVGLFGKITEEKIEAFEEMFQIDVLRGSDGCGIAVVGKDKVDVVKDIVWPNELMATDEYENLVWQSDVRDLRALIAHNRASTRGAVSKKNAHPFTHDHITMVHNGTVWTWKFPGEDKDTDSETICHSIANRGIEETWKIVDGAAVLVYWDDIKKKLCIIGNGKRPMWFMEWGDNSESIFWASEPWMMVTAAMRAGVPYNIQKLYSIDNNKLYEFEYVDGRVNYTSTKLEEYKEPKRSSNLKGYWHNHKFHPYMDEWGYGYDSNEDADEVELYNNHSKNCNCAECCSMRVSEYEKHCEKMFKDEETEQEKVEADNDDNKGPFPGEEGYKPADSSNSRTLLTLTSTRRVANLKVNVTHKRVDEQVFKNNFKTCSCCGKPLEQEYDKAIVINYTTHDALCMLCAAVGEFRPQPGATIPIDMKRATTVTMH